jgi:hypothetical protein
MHGRYRTRTPPDARVARERTTGRRCAAANRRGRSARGHRQARSSIPARCSAGTPLAGSTTRRLRGPNRPLDHARTNRESSREKPNATKLETSSPRCSVTRPEGEHAPEHFSTEPGTRRRRAPCSGDADKVGEANRERRENVEQIERPIRATRDSGRKEYRHAARQEAAARQAEVRDAAEQGAHPAEEEGRASTGYRRADPAPGR